MPSSNVIGIRLPGASAAAMLQLLNDPISRACFPNLQLISIQPLIPCVLDRVMEVMISAAQWHPHMLLRLEYEKYYSPNSLKTHGKYRLLSKAWGDRLLPEDTWGELFPAVVDRLISAQNEGDVVPP